MLCRLENTENGKTKFISLPKSDSILASMLEDIGVTAETNDKYKVSYIGTRRPELAKRIMEMGLSIEELNRVAIFIFDKGECWEKHFVMLLNVFKPKTKDDFFKLMKESVAYHFFDASNDEQLGRLFRKMIEEQNQFLRRYSNNSKKNNDKEIGELVRACTEGEYVEDGKYMVRREIQYGVTDSDLSMGEAWFSMNNEPCCTCKISIADMNRIKKEVRQKHQLIELNLPMTMNEIHKMLQPLNTDNIAYIFNDSKTMFPVKQAETMSLWEINELAEIWSEFHMGDYQAEKLYEIMSYEGKSLTFDNIIDYVQRMSDYRFYPNATELTNVTHNYQIKEKYLHDDPYTQRMCSKMEIVVELMKKFEGRIIKKLGIILYTKGENGFEEYYDIDYV